MTERIDWTLQRLKGFQKPKIKLEQYATSAEMAVSIVECMDETLEDGLDGKLVADLGCGCGMLMLAIGLSHDVMGLVGVDIDEEAIKTCQQNIEKVELEHISDVICCDVMQVDKTIHRKFDVIIMNPPFGTKNNAGVDMQFVKSGLSLVNSGGSLFSIHKTSTRSFIEKTAKSWEGIEMEALAELRWELPPTYKFHKKQSVDIEVDLIRFHKTS